MRGYGEICKNVFRKSVLSAWGSKMSQAFSNWSWEIQSCGPLAVVMHVLGLEMALCGV